MKNADIRNLVIIWILGLLISFGTGLLYYVAGEVGSLNPTEAEGTTSWTTAPASDLAVMVRGNVAWTIAVITPFFFAPLMTLAYIIIRFRQSANPKAATFHENVPLEVFWSIIPAVFLVAMALPAFNILAYMDREPDSVDHVVDVTGYQFYWQYNFPKYGVTITDDGTGEEPLYLPVDNNIILYGQSPQVNHAWWVPAFGLKFDVIPGRITRGWIRPNQKGFYKGQCAELCGPLHAYMLIHVKVVDEKDFYQWLLDKGAVFPPDEAERVEALLGQDVPTTAGEEEEAETSAQNETEESAA